jgi:IclR family transcriptional regulator, blcABC operon repressor
VSESRQSVPAIRRAVRVLDELASEKDGLGVSELARRLDLPKSSVMTICHTLVDVGLARRHQSGFVLGSKLVELSASYLAGVSIASEFQDVCVQWPGVVEETIQLAVLDDDLSVTYLARRDGAHPVRLAMNIGRRLPAHCTAVGRAILAELPEDELEARLGRSGRLPALTTRSITTVAELRRNLDQVRRDGYAVDEEEAVAGVVCVGAAVASAGEDDDHAGVCFTLLKAGASKRRVTKLSSDIQGIARELAARLGNASD